MHLHPNSNSRSARAADEGTWCTGKMRHQFAKVAEVLPEEEILIPADDLRNKLFTEAAGAAAVFMNDLALNCHQALPSNLPCAVREIGILDIKGVVYPIKASQPQEFVAIHGNRPSVLPLSTTTISCSPPSKRTAFSNAGSDSANKSFPSHVTITMLHRAGFVGATKGACRLLILRSTRATNSEATRVAPTAHSRGARKPKTKALLQRVALAQRARSSCTSCTRWVSSALSLSAQAAISSNSGCKYLRSLRTSVVNAPNEFLSPTFSICRGSLHSSARKALKTNW